MSKIYEDKSFFQKFLFSKLHGGKFNYLEIGDEDAVCVTHHVFKPKVRETKVDFNELSFFDMKKKKVTFGDECVIEFKHLKSKDASEIRDDVMAKSKNFSESLKLASEGSVEKKFYMRGRTLGQFIVCLFSKEVEYVQMVDKGIIHRRDSRNGARNSFIPYDKVDFATFSEKYFLFPFLFRKERVFISGSLTFGTKFFVKGSEANEIRKKLAEHVKMLDGKVYHPGVFSGVDHRKSYSLYILNDKIIYMHDNDMAVIKKVSKYSCKPIFSLFKRVASIDGYSEVDKRTGKAEEINITFPGIFFFSWWGMKGKIKKLR